MCSLIKYQKGNKLEIANNENAQKILNILKSNLSEKFLLLQALSLVPLSSF